MKQVEILYSSESKDIKHKVNGWMENNPYKVLDIKFSISSYGPSGIKTEYAVMIIYEVK